MNLYRIHRAMLLLLLTTPTGGIAADVLKHHLNDTRDGNYIDPALTQTAVQTTHWDSSFYAPVPGPILRNRCTFQTVPLAGRRSSW